MSEQLGLPNVYVQRHRGCFFLLSMLHAIYYLCYSDTEASMSPGMW